MRFVSTVLQSFYFILYKADFFKMNCHVPSRHAITFLGITESIIKESGDERNDGKGRKSRLYPLPSHHSPLAVYAHFHHPPLAPLACLQLSRIACSPLSLGKACGVGNCWFSHDVTKIQTKKLLILPRFYFHDALEQLKTNFHTNFRFKRVLGFEIEYA